MTQPAHRPEPGEIVPFPAPVALRDAAQAPRDGTSHPLDAPGDYTVAYLASLEPQQLNSSEAFAERKYLEASIANFTTWGHEAEARMAQAQLDALFAAIGVQIEEAANAS